MGHLVYFDRATVLAGMLSGDSILELLWAVSLQQQLEHPIGKARGGAIPSHLFELVRRFLLGLVPFPCKLGVIVSPIVSSATTDVGLPRGLRDITSL